MMSSEDHEDIGKKFLEEIRQMEEKAYLFEDPEKQKKCLRLIEEIRELWGEE